MENNRKKKAIVTAVIVCTLILIGFLGSYAYFINTPKTKNQEVSVQTGNLSLIFEDGTSSFQGTLNFGDSATKTFTIENNGSLDATAVMYFDNLVNTYLLGSLTYTLSYSETEDREYQELVSNRNVPRSEESTSRILADNLSIPSKQKYYYKLTITLNYLNDVDQTADLNAIFSSNFKLEETGNRSLETLKNLGLKSKKGTPDFALPATTDETVDGLYSMEDDYGTSYYFRGAVENNYVKFAGFYWRIIRINGEGSLRIQYDGTNAHKNGESSEDRSPIFSYFNSNAHDAKHLGYMYGGAESDVSTNKEQAQANETDSNAKKLLDTWYKTNIENEEFDKYISDTLFCNDRSTAEKPYKWHSADTTLGYGKNVTVFGASHRLAFDLKEPSFKCSQPSDRFTVNSQAGNLKLRYPVGMITVDEAIVNGAVNDIPNNNYFLYKGHAYWTMTPSAQWTDGYTNQEKIWPDGRTRGWDVTAQYGINPVINIKPEYAEKLIGTGYMSDPYRLEDETL